MEAGEDTLREPSGADRPDVPDVPSDEPGAAAFPVPATLPDDEPLLHLPTATQVAAALSALALVGPAALGGMPVLPVTIEDERRRSADEIGQQSASTVGVHQDAQEAATALALSQGRLAAVTREVQGSHAHDVSESDVVEAAHLVSQGAVSPRQRQRFRSALGQVANDSVDLFILEQEETPSPEDASAAEEDDLEAWLASFA